MRQRPTTLVFLLLALAATVLVACSDDGEPVSTASSDGGTDGSPDGGTDGSGTSTLGGAKDGLALEIEYWGGLVPMEVAFRTMPSVVVYDDGRSVMPGPVPEIYPGPAVPPLLVGQLTPEDLAEIEAAAREAGLDEPRSAKDFGTPAIADAATTDITLVFDGKRVVTSVYALGLEENSGHGVDDEQVSERKDVAAFVDLASKLATTESTEEFAVDRYRVMGTPYDSAVVDEAVEPNEIEWPAEVELIKDTCIAVTGADAEALAGSLDEATDITRWVQDGKAWRLAIRPVLPHEPDC